MSKHIFLMTSIILLYLTLLASDFNYISKAFAEQYAEFNGDKPTKADLATPPKCGSAEIIFGVFSGMMTITLFYVLGGPVSWQALLVHLGITAAFVLSSMIFFACTYSFVRHPVLRFSDGQYKTCTNPKEVEIGRDQLNSQKVTICENEQYSIADKYDWPKNKSPNSDYIEFCYRFPIPTTSGLFTNKELDQREKDTSSKFLQNIKSNFSGDLTCKTLQSGQSILISGIKYKAYYSGNKICVSAYGIGDLKWPLPAEIGCHLRAPYPAMPMCTKATVQVDNNGNSIGFDNSSCLNCYVSNACYSGSGIFSHAPFPITSVVVQCLKESLGNIINGCTGNDNGFLAVARKALQKTILAVLTLSVILFGIKLLMGAISEMQEILMLIIKMSIVIYFAMGDGANEYYSKLITISNGLSAIVLSAGGNETICDYKSSEYRYPSFKPASNPSENEYIALRKIILANSYHASDSILNNKDAIDHEAVFNDVEYNNFVNKLQFNDNSYLLMWDVLDCRMAFYLGNSIFSAGAATGIGPILLVWPLGLLFAGQLLMFLAIVVLVFMMIMIIIWVVNIYMFSLILLTLIFTFAPLFIPMMLFQATKGFYDGWLKEIVAYSIYPIILFAFLGLMFSAFDKIYFKELKFVRKKDQNVTAVRNIYNFVLSDETSCDKDKFQSIACVVSTTNFITKPLIFGIDVTSPNILGSSEVLWRDFALMALIAFLFHHFLGIFGALAGELSGSYRADLSRAVSSPLEMAKKVAGATASGISKIHQMAAKKNQNAKKSEGGEGDNKKKESVGGGS